MTEDMAGGTIRTAAHEGPPPRYFIKRRQRDTAIHQIGESITVTNDLTRGNPAKQILFFTIPLLIGNLFQQFYSMADTMIVGRTIGVDALAAVGATGSLSFLIIGFSQGLTSGFAVITAQRFGAGDMDGVRKSVTSGILLSAGITVILTAVSVPLARPVLRLMQTPDNILDDAYAYIVVIFAGIGASVMFNLLSNIIRALGDSRTPLLFLAVACVLNVGLDFALILWCSMGVAGAAVATVISQVVSGGLCMLYMIRRFPVLRLRKRDWIPERKMLWNDARVGLPMGFQMSIIAIGSMILQIALNRLGSTAIAGFIAAQKIDQLANQPMMSFGITMATYAAQNYGAGNMRRIRTGVRQCILMSVGFSIVSGVVLILAAKPLAGLFVGADQPEVPGYVQTYLLLNASMYFLLALLFIFRYTLQGLGKSLFPTIAGVAELLMRTLAAVVLANIWGYAGVCLSNPIAWLGALVPLTTAYVLTIRRLVRGTDGIPPSVLPKEAAQMEEPAGGVPSP